MSEPTTIMTGVPKEELEMLWPHARPYVENVLMRGFEEYSIEDVYTKLLEGNMQLWIFLDEKHEIGGCLITRVVMYPQMRVCEIVFGSFDDLDKYVHFYEVIEEWARENEVDVMRIYGRRGWTKKLAPFGYKQTSILYTRDLRGFDNESTH